MRHERVGHERPRDNRAASDLTDRNPTTVESAVIGEGRGWREREAERQVDGRDERRLPHVLPSSHRALPRRSRRRWRRGSRWGRWKAGGAARRRGRGGHRLPGVRRLWPSPTRGGLPLGYIACMVGILW